MVVGDSVAVSAGPRVAVLGDSTVTVTVGVRETEDGV